MHAQNLWRKLLQVALKSQNLCKLSPSKISCYTALCNVHSYLNRSPSTGLACRCHLMAVLRALMPIVWQSWWPGERTHSAAMVSKVFGSTDGSLVICSSMLSRSWWPSFNFASNSYSASREWVGSEGSLTPPIPIWQQTEWQDAIFSNTDSNTRA